MRIAGVDWSGCRSPASKEEVDAAEEKLGVVFPPAYRNCLIRCGGGRPIMNSFSLIDPDIGEMESCVGVLLAMTADNTEGLVQTNEALEGRIPPGVVAIADDGGGAFICLDYRSGSPPVVAYWSYDSIDVVLLSSSFEEFLRSLY